MAEEFIFANFRKSLEHAMGVPASRTPEAVEETLNNTWSETVDALDRFAEMLIEQDSSILIDQRWEEHDLKEISATKVLGITGPKGSKTITFTVFRDGVQARSGYLSTANHEEKGWWPKDQEDDFIERLSFAILDAAGVDLEALP